MRKVLLLFVSWRLLLFVPLIYFNSLLNIRKGYEYTFFTEYLEHEGVLSGLPNFLSAYANFDGVHYLTIAHQGYTVNAGFFPFFPIVLNLLSYLLSVFLRADPHLLLFFSGLFLSSIFFYLGLLYFYKLLKFDYKESLILQIILLLLCFPTSFFYATIYSESLYFLLTILCFYFLRKKKFIVASFFALLLTSTRPVGIAIIPAILLEFYLHYKVPIKALLVQPMKNISIWVSGIVLTIISLSGIVAYSLFNYSKWHDFLYFVHAQGEFKNNRSVDSVILFPQTVYRYIKILFTVSSAQFEWWIALYEISIFFLVCLLFFISWKKKVRMSYLFFAVISFLIPISTGTFSSLPRYTLVLFPIFIALALIKRTTVKIAYIIVGIGLQFLLFLLFSKGYFVG